MHDDGNVTLIILLELLEGDRHAASSQGVMWGLCVSNVAGVIMGVFASVAEELDTGADDKELSVMLLRV